MATAAHSTEGEVQVADLAEAADVEDVEEVSAMASGDGQDNLGMESDGETTINVAVCDGEVNLGMVDDDVDVQAKFLEEGQTQNNDREAALRLSVSDRQNPIADSVSLSNFSLAEGTTTRRTSSTLSHIPINVDVPDRPSTTAPKPATAPPANANTKTTADGTLWTESAIDQRLGPPDRRLMKGATNNLQTMMHIFKGNVGPGILAMPYAFSNVGLIPGLVVTVLIALINVHCMRLVVFASHKLCFISGKQTLDYGYCMDYAFKTFSGSSPQFQKTGRYMRKAVNLFLQITQLGFCCVYFVFISENLGQVINHHVFGVIDNSSVVVGSTVAPQISWRQSEVEIFASRYDGAAFIDNISTAAPFGNVTATPATTNNVTATPESLASAGLSPRIYMTMLLPLIMTLACVRDIGTLAYCSTAANILCITGFLMIFIQLLQDIPPISSIPLINEDYTVWPIYMATTVYAFEGIGVVLPLENKMRTPSALLPWNGVLNTAMSVVSGLFLAMGFFGYLKYGDKCQGSITLNLPAHAVINEVVKVMFAVAVFFTYSVQFFVPIQIMWPMLKSKITNEKLVDHAERLFRCCLVLCTYLLAVAVPHLGPFISLIGAFASTALAMLFPVIIDTIVNWRPSASTSSFVSTLRILKNLFIFTFGLISFVLGTTQSIREIVKAFASQ